MNQELFATENRVYKRQIAVLAFFMSMTYKIVMLPQYLSIIAPRDAIIAVAIMMFIETAIFFVIYATISISPLYRLGLNKIILKIVLLIIVVSSSFKLVVLLGETLDYISSLLFEEGKWLFIALSVLPVLGYIAYKGVNTITRLAEIIMWFIVLTLGFTLLFLKVNMDIGSVLPLFDDGFVPIGSAIDKYVMWYGDYTPLLLVVVAKENKTKMSRYVVPVGMMIIYIITVGFYLLFISIYGDIAPFIDHAFSNIGIYNKISDLLGGVDFPIVCAWLLMSIVKLSFLIYAIIEGVSKIIKDEPTDKLRGIIATAITIGYGLILSFVVESIEDSYKFAISGVRYFTAITDYVLPILLFLFALKQYAVRRRREKDQGVQEIIPDNDNNAIDYGGNESNAVVQESGLKEKREVNGTQVMDNAVGMDYASNDSSFVVRGGSEI